MKKKLFSAIFLASLLSGCSVTTLNRYPVEQNVTEYQNYLKCFESKALNSLKNNKGVITISVGNVDDYSGKISLVDGKKVSSGISHMVTTALAKTNVVRVVERIDRSVFDVELNLSNNKVLGDDEPGYRKIFPGQVLGSDYYIAGGITEINYLISGGSEFYINGIGGGTREYIMEIAADFRVVNTRTTEIVKAISLKKRITGKEVKSGIFSFFGNVLIDVNSGFKVQEPLNVGVRDVIETSVALLLADIYGIELNCNNNDIIYLNRYENTELYPGGYKRYVDRNIESDRVRIFGMQ
jgi:curli production assembly/transport component CsgG/holdfast attachment protein HfaB